MRRLTHAGHVGQLRRPSNSTRRFGVSFARTTLFGVTHRSVAGCIASMMVAFQCMDALAEVRGQLELEETYMRATLIWLTATTTTAAVAAATTVSKCKERALRSSHFRGGALI
eukprot:TRINITY_DN44576_c0_g1_i1.p1 TRINITY_DN44576_c0_g1~~TRINITY_DN44576_c0_g1_i1.p1  ORF type:complete len:113 (-),score=7.75 TRINITY_DN44576_c0_g1_i1:304-642(-)